jgi:hypothetical protein
MRSESVMPSDPAARGRSESVMPSDSAAARRSEHPMPGDPAVGARSTPKRYRAEYVWVNSSEPRDQLQAVLDEKDSEVWHLVGVASGLPEGGMVLFWDTQRPSFGRGSGRRS